MGARIGDEVYEAKGCQAVAYGCGEDGSQGVKGVKIIKISSTRRIAISRVDDGVGQGSLLAS